MIEIRVSKTAAAIAALKEDWSLLFSESGCSPFMSWEWMSAWYEHFCVGRDPFVITVYRNNELIGILPMLLHSASHLGIKTPVVSLAGDGAGGADHLDIISRPEDQQETFLAALDFISKETGAGSIRLANLSADSSALRIGPALCEAAGAVHDRYSMSVAALSPQIDLSMGWTAVLSNCKRASNYKRRLKQVTGLTGFEFRSVTSAEDIPDAFERFLHLHDQRWEQAGGSELSGHPRLVEFQRDLVRRLAAGSLIRFDEVWIDGACRSSAYGLESGGTFYYYNSGYDLDYRSKSVGLVLLGLSVNAAVDRGIEVYDFLRGDESYKFDWATRTREILDVTLTRDTFALKASRAAVEIGNKLKEIGRSTLPAAWTTAIADRRRAWKRNYQLSGQ